MLLSACRSVDAIGYACALLCELGVPAIRAHICHAILTFSKLKVAGFIASIACRWEEGECGASLIHALRIANDLLAARLPSPS